MTKGYPDWGVLEDEIIAVSTDTNELAVRLGSAYRVSRTGHVYYQTHFAEDFRMWRVTADAGTPRVSVDNSIGAFLRGALAVNNTLANDCKATISNRLPYIGSKKFGIETLIWFNTGNVEFDLKLIINDGTNDYVYGLRVNSNTDIIALLDSDAAFDTVLSKTITPSSADDKWIYLKLVIDHFNLGYQRLTVNDTDIVNITQTPDINAVADLEYTKLIMSVDNTANTAFKFRVASLVLTVDEP